MPKNKVIKMNNLPTRLPFVATLVYYLVLDRFNAPGWVWGAVGVLMLLVWILAIVNLMREEDVDLFFKESEKL